MGGENKIILCVNFLSKKIFQGGRMKTNFSIWVRLNWPLLSLLLFFPSNSFGQIISIDEFLQTTMASQEVTETFSYDCPDKYYSSNYSDKYLAITLSQPRTIDTEEGVVDIHIPKRAVIFNSQGELVNIMAKYKKFRVAGFLEGEKDYYVFEQWVGNNHEIGIYDMDGNFVKPLNCRYYIYCSPTGKFYYHSGSESNLTIYDGNGDRLFTIPTGGRQFKANAASDSTLLVFNRNTLSFWNIKTQEIIWERDIPGKRKAIVDGSSGIKYSIPGNVIALHSSFGYYCFNFQGDFLWAEEDYSVRSKLLKYTGVSKSSGDVAIVYSKFGTSHSLFAKIFNHEGILLEEHEIQLGENVKYAGNTNFTAMVFNDFVLISIAASAAGQGIEFATCILYKENQSWSSAVVGGFWYFLNEGSQMERLIGYDSISQQIRGYEIK